MQGSNHPLQPQQDSAAETLSRRFRPALLAYFLRRIHDYGEAEDLTHEVLLRLSQRSATLDASRPDGYVFQVAANLLKDRYRRQKVRNEHSVRARVEDLWLEERDPHRVLEGRQTLEIVVEALKTLPERTRTIFILFRLEKMKQRDIAQALGVSVRTVEQHVIRASIALRACLQGNQ
jgi:RNA polymerase sigma factor (sigma-70 family)